MPASEKAQTDEKAARADYVLRAMAASEIAESCPDPAIRRAFLTLAARWLWIAQSPREGLCGKAGLGTPPYAS
jgi:hypothetical protein